MELSTRMKRYEQSYGQFLPPRTPLIIRLDGKAFRTWTNGLTKPFDDDFRLCMLATTKYLVDNIQGAVLGYTQSDEISILLNTYKNIETHIWYDGNIQKICSVSASMATAVFNHAVSENLSSKKEFAFFDSRCFALPKEEVNNYFIWRQKDGIRNSIRTVGLVYLGHKECMNLSNAEVLDELKHKHNVIWANYPTMHQRGAVYSDKIFSLEIPDFRDVPEYIETKVYQQGEVENVND